MVETMMHTAEGMKRPVQIEEFTTAIREMSSPELQNIRKEIENSMFHLNKSNERLKRYIAKIEGEEQKYFTGLEDEVTQDELDSIDVSDLHLYNDSLRENEIVLKNCQERIDALNQENIFRTSGHSSTPISNTTKQGDKNNDTMTSSNEPNVVYL